MALSSESNRQTYSASAGQTVFPFTLPFFDATTVSGVKYGDIRVYLEETDGTLTSLTANASPAAGQFKVETGNPANGCNVTLGSAASVGDIIVIERDVAYTQEYDLQEGSTIDPTALNKALDRIVAQNQQQNDAFTRTVEFPVTDSGVTYTVGSATSRANKALGFDANGNVAELNIAEEGGFAVNNNAGLELASGQLSAKVDGVTTEFSSGNIAVKDAGISTSKLADDAVTAAKIDANAVTTAKILNDNVTYDKLQDVSTFNSVLGNTGTGTVTERALVGDILLNDPTLASNSSIKGATQQSVKGYVDNKILDPLRVYNNLSHSTVNNAITENDSGRPLFVSYGFHSSNDIWQIDFNISPNSDMSGSTLISQFMILSSSDGDSEATVTGIVPANWYWRITRGSTDATGIHHRSFAL